jgi:hypothetical protein
MGGLVGAGSSLLDRLSDGGFKIVKYPSGDGVSVAKAMEAEDHRPYRVGF